MRGVAVVSIIFGIGFWIDTNVTIADITASAFLMFAVFVYELGEKLDNLAT